MRQIYWVGAQGLAPLQIHVGWVEALRNPTNPPNVGFGSLLAPLQIHVGWVEALRNPTNPPNVGFRSSTQPTIFYFGNAPKTGNGALRLP
ncbi:MAG: hypothetical protein ACFKPT_03870 [Gloeotrichia echinulata GP01]